MCAMKRSQNQPRNVSNDISEAQMKVLQYILVNGASSASDIPHIASSTAQVSMKRLEERGLVKFEKEEPMITGLPKKIFSLTMMGFCLGFSQIALSATTTYDMTESAIKRWQHLCPEILGNWDLLIRVPREECSFPKLPYPVPSNSVPYWIFFLGNCCLKSAGEAQRQGRGYNLTSHHFSFNFCDLVVGCILYGPVWMEGCGFGEAKYWDVEYTLRTIRGIPSLWTITNGVLELLKAEAEDRVLRIGQLYAN